MLIKLEDAIKKTLFVFGKLPFLHPKKRRLSKNAMILMILSVQKVVNQCFVQKTKNQKKSSMGRKMFFFLALKEEASMCLNVPKN